MRTSRELNLPSRASEQRERAREAPTNLDPSMEMGDTLLADPSRE